jgi:TadE-like protein
MRALHLPRSKRGQALTEFAIVLPVFLMLVFAIIDLGRVVWAMDNVANAAREGARYASVHGTSKFVICPTGPGLTGTPATGCPTWTPDSKQPTRGVARGFVIAGGTNIAVGVCYYAATACVGDTDEIGIKAQRGAYVTVRITSTVPILTGKLLGLNDFTVSGTSTVLVNN